MRPVRNLVKRNWKRAFELGQRLGVDVLPRHFYSSVPDFRELRRDDSWRRPYDLHGVTGADVGEQRVTLDRWATDERRERLARGDVWPDACAAVGERGYGAADADALWCFAAEHRPRRVVQVGCGVSTAVLLRCADEEGFDLSITCVEPYPSDFLRSDGRITLIEAKAEDVPADELAELSAGDVLFIDSTHATRPNSDVHHLYLRVLPRLPASVRVHVHDVTLPYDFGPNVLGPNDLFFGGEVALLYAYLLHNPRCRIDVSLSMLHHADAAWLGGRLPNFEGFAADRGLNPPDKLGLSPSACYLEIQ